MTKVINIQDGINFIKEEFNREIESFYELIRHDWIYSKIPDYGELPDMNSWNTIGKRTINDLTKFNNKDFGYYFIWTQFVYIVRDFIKEILKFFQRFSWHKNLIHQIKKTREVKIKSDVFGEGGIAILLEHWNSEKINFDYFTFYEYRTFFHHPFNIKIQINGETRRYYSDIELKKGNPIIWLKCKNLDKNFMFALKNSFEEEFLSELKWIWNLLMNLNSNLKMDLNQLNYEKSKILKKTNYENLKNISDEFKSIDKTDSLRGEINSLLYIRENYNFKKHSSFLKEFIDYEILMIIKEFNDDGINHTRKYEKITKQMDDDYHYFSSKIGNHDFFASVSEFDYYQRFHNLNFEDFAQRFPTYGSFQTIWVFTNLNKFIKWLDLKDFYNEIIKAKKEILFTYSDNSEKDAVRIMINFYHFIAWKLYSENKENQ